MKKYLVIFEKTSMGYSAYIPDLPGYVAAAETKVDTEKLIYEAIQFHLEGMALDGLTIPENSCESEVMVFA